MSKQIPTIEESTRFNFITSIWIVPFIALLIAGWLAFQYFAQLGPEIRIIFPKNEGLQAGQSQIKYRDVPVGTIKKIELQEDGDGVVVVARMDKNIKKYLDDNTKFWIVKPEVGIGGVSGLDTLISGTYVKMYRSKDEMVKKQFKNQFRGLSRAYKQTGEGEFFKLNAPFAYNIVKGTPIYFKNIEVGQVEQVAIAPNGNSIDFVVFVENQYVAYVHEDSKFWVMSALDIDFSNGRFDVNIAPITHLIHGGIAFSSVGKNAKEKVGGRFVFPLYKNESMALNKAGKGGESLAVFKIFVEKSIAKLKENASVRYDGFEVGQVKEVKTSYDVKTHGMRGNVLLQIDTSFFEDEKEANLSGKSNFYKAVEEGLCAKITSADPLTGMLFVDLVFDKNMADQKVIQKEQYAVLPTIESDDSDIMGSVQNVLAKLNALPLEKLLASVNNMVDDNAQPLHQVMVDLQKTVSNLNAMTERKSFKAMPDELVQTMQELTKTLKATRKLVKGYDNDSLLTQQIAQTLKVVTETSNEMQEFIRMLNRKPTSMIFGDK
ncbi:MAG: paraquat-inducible protein [Campylobacterota bacterium]|nr:paraquat-inducible protein [Campylobacterota bacterium]